MDLKTVFESERINFVKLSERLVPEYLAMINDVEHVQKQIRRTYVPRDPFTEEQEIEWVRKNLEEKALAFSMIEKVSGDFIGNIDLRNRQGAEAELGIAITAKKQNMGYGTEAVAAVIGYGMDRAGLKRITLRANPDNKRAIHVYEKCGFREYDRTEEHVLMELTR